MRFLLPNLCLALAAAAIAMGGAWPICGAAAALFFLGCVDEAAGDDRSTPAPLRRWVLDVNLYATLPLLGTATYLYLNKVADFHPMALGAAVAKQPSLGEIGAAAVLLGYCYAVFGATVAHELIHRAGNRGARFCATCLLAGMGNAAFVVFHGGGHHRLVATLADPATARRGESVWAFLVRSTAGQLAEAYAHEGARLRRKGAMPFSWRNRVLSQQAYSAAMAIAAWLIAGGTGVLAVVAVAAIGRAVHELVNYVQHFGLVRVDGAPVRHRHSWDCYRRLSNALHYNLPRHADHHVHGKKRCWDLAAEPGAPVLPFGYQSMALIALFPPLWRRVMRPRLAEWDRHCASTAETALIHRRGWAGLS